MTEPSTVQASGEAPPEPGRRDEPVPPLYGELRPALASLTALLLSVGLLSLATAYRAP